MFKDPKSVPPETAQTPIIGEMLQHADRLQPWEDRSLAPEKRLEAYTDLVREKLEGIERSFDRAADVGDKATQIEIMNSAETKKWMDEGTWVKTLTAKEFCERIDRSSIIRELLGKNFLGADAWKAQGLDVGEIPPIPISITRSLLESECSLHPGKRIQDTHLLVLLPQNVNGEPYSALKLRELCSTRKGSGERLIKEQDEWAIAWQEAEWARAPRPGSQWILIPKGDPDPNQVASDRHFRGKSIVAQQRMNEELYPDYREARVIELMTAVLLYDLVHHERLLSDELRCQEPSAYVGRVLVGDFCAKGLIILDDFDLSSSHNIGRALVRKVSENPPLSCD